MQQSDVMARSLPKKWRITIAKNIDESLDVKVQKSEFLCCCYVLLLQLLLLLFIVAGAGTGATVSDKSSASETILKSQTPVSLKCFGRGLTI